jgi:trehalose-phosphatase
VLRAGVDPEAFFAGLAPAPARILLLDYDGTLAPFQEARARAVPWEEAAGLVRSIQADGATRVVVISGRSVADLAPLLGLDPPPELWGSHGWERLRPDGRREPAELNLDARDRLERAATLARERAPADRIEIKPASVAVHVRGFSEDAAAALLDGVRAAWTGLTGVSLQVHDFDGGLELRAQGRDKGTAVREILSEEPAGSAIAYLGDDLTDEDAFRALGDRGLSVLVRAELRPTSADLWIQPPEELFEFLRRWRARSAGAARPAGTSP